MKFQWNTDNQTRRDQIRNQGIKRKPM